MIKIAQLALWVEGVVYALVAIASTSATTLTIYTIKRCQNK